MYDWSTWCRIITMCFIPPRTSKSFFLDTMNLNESKRSRFKSKIFLSEHHFIDYSFILGRVQFLIKLHLLRKTTVPQQSCGGNVYLLPPVYLHLIFEISSVTRFFFNFEISSLKNQFDFQIDFCRLHRQ